MKTTLLFLLLLFLVPADSGRLPLRFPEKASRCTWACHNNTGFCIGRHVRATKNLLPVSRPVYSWVVRTLRSTGHYRLASLLLFALIFPALKLLLLAEGTRIRRRIERIKPDRL